MTGERHTLPDSPGAATDVTTPSNPSTTQPSLKRLGRYQLIELIGKGGMGSVFVAHDTTLDRRVALKLLPASEQMLNEARALARLSHPNVVAIYDVGEETGPAGEQHAWMAMELLSGKPFDLWLREVRTWREVVQLFIRCGMGLQAVHTEGLVHGDFKASNVMVRGDGRVQLIDFGIARKSARRDQNAPLAELVSGTPGYMSPEQLEGKPLDARSDQFSFCCALWEALYGELPFGVGADEAHFDRIHRGPPQPPPKSKVPKRLAQALQRGLMPKPQQRYQSMGAMLRAIKRAVPPSRKGWVALAAASALAGTSVAVAWVGFQTDCKPARLQLMQSWNGELRPRVLAAQPQSLVKQLDEHVRSLAKLSERVCVDFAKSRKPPAELVEDRTCLNHRTAEYFDVVEALAQGAPSSVADGLLAAESCDAAARGEPLADFERLAPCRTSLAEAAASLAEGAWAQAHSQIERSHTCAQASRDLMLQATALRYDGLLQERLGNLEGAEKLLQQAVTMSLRSGASEAQVPGWMSLARVVGVRQRGRQAEADRWREYAAAAAQAGATRRELNQSLALLYLQLNVLAKRPVGSDASIDALPAARAWRAVPTPQASSQIEAALAQAVDVDTLMDVSETLRALPKDDARLLVPVMLKHSERMLRDSGASVALSRLWFARLARELDETKLASALVDDIARQRPEGWPGTLVKYEQALLARGRGESEKAKALFESVSAEASAAPLEWLEVRTQ